MPASPIQVPSVMHVELLQKDLTDLAGNLLDTDPTPGYPSRRLDYGPFVHFGSRPSDQVMFEPALVRDRWTERPYLAFVEQPLGSVDGPQQIVVARWTAGAWERLPALHPLSKVSPGSQLLLGIGSALQPVLGWCEEDCTRLYMKRFDGSSWVDMGDPLETRKAARMAMDALGNPVLLLKDRDIFLRVVRWDGQAWIELGGPPTCSKLSIAAVGSSAIAANADKIVVAWPEVTDERDDGLGSRVCVAQYAGGSWSFVSAPIPLSGYDSGGAHSASVALDPAGIPLVAWSEISKSAPSDSLYFARWEERGGWSAPQQLARYPSLFKLSDPFLRVDAQGEPWVAWHHLGGVNGPEITYRRHRSTGWEPLQPVGTGYLDGLDFNERGFPLMAITQLADTELVLPR